MWQHLLPRWLQVYLAAFQLTQDKQYAWVARDILDYLMRDMTHPEGGIYAAEVGTVHANQLVH